jgi:hypothetical protein
MARPRCVWDDGTIWHKQVTNRMGSTNLLVVPKSDQEMG